jgi:hypothetical protein
MMMRIKQHFESEGELIRNHELSEQDALPKSTFLRPGTFVRARVIWRLLMQ